MNRAARTIDRLLHALINGSLQEPTENPPIEDQSTSMFAGADLTAANDMLFSNPLGIDSLGYEMDFWQTLGEHPSLLSPQLGIAE